MAPKHFKGGEKKNQKWKEDISSETKGAGSIVTSCWGLASTIYTVLQDTSENTDNNQHLDKTEVKLKLFLYGKNNLWQNVNWPLIGGS